MILSLDIFKGLVLLLLLVLLMMFSLPQSAQERARFTPALAPPAIKLTENGDFSFAGTGEPGTQVQVVANGEIIGQTQVQDDGTWSLATELDQSGEMEVEVQTIDAEGEVLATSEAIQLRGETTANQAQDADNEADSATDGADDSDSEGDSATNGADSSDSSDSVDSQGDVTLSIPTLLLTGVDLVDNEARFIGTGTPGSEIEVLVDGEIVGSSQIEGDGTWALTLELGQQGSVEVQVFMTTDDEVTAVSERAILNLATSATTIDLPFLISPTEITTGDVTFSGIGSPGAEIQLVIDGQPTEPAQIDQDGIWLLTTQLDKPGEIEVQAQMIDAEGNVIVATEAITLTVTVAESE